jgi:hypothetical protein
MHLLRRSVYAASALVFCGLIPVLASARTIYWKGAGVDTKWSTVANWSGSVVPGAGDTALLTGVSVKDATIPATTTVGGISITSAYTGTVSQSGGSILTVGTGSFVMGGGTFKGGSGYTVIQSGLTLSGGVLVAPSRGLSVLGNVTRTGGSYTPNHGTLVLAASGSQTLTSGGAGLGNLQLDDYGMIGHWRFDETSGTTAKDTSGFGFDGAYTGAGTTPSSTIAPVTFSNGRSLHYNGSSCVNVPGLMGKPSSFTLSAWINMPVEPGQSFSDIIDIGNYDDLRYSGTGAQMTGFFHPFNWNFASNQVNTFTLVGNGWHHVAYTAKSGYQAVYVVLQRKEFDVLVPGHPGLRVGLRGSLVACDVVLHQ